MALLGMKIMKEMLLSSISIVAAIYLDGRNELSSLVCSKEQF